MSNQVFDRYAEYYNLLYRDKDYTGEADFVAKMIRSHQPSAVRLLELGCGNGHHAELLVARGFQLHGVDRSEGMLANAENRRLALADDLRDRLSFSNGDVRDTRLDEQFDAVVSLFHVASYMTTNDDLDRFFATARAHLRPGGLFLFDCWYGPAVLNDQPAVRVKRLADNKLEITRIAEPLMHPNDNVVDVNYEVHIVDRKTHARSILRECHRMRYLFMPEIYALFARHGMRPVVAVEWMTGKEPGFDTWYVCAGGVSETE